MSDEIEIEEHDLLDDPTVRNIFPDISRLKQEILDYGYVEAPDFENAVTTTSRSDSCDDTFRSTENSEETKIALPDDFKHNFQDVGPSNGFIRRDKGIEMKICNNKIIIGSKPIHSVDSKVEHFEKNIKPYCAVVVVEDFGIYLNSSTRYCQNCHILFPTNLDYNNHEKNIHQELVNNIDEDDDKIVIRSEYSEEDKSSIQKNKETEARNTCNEYEDVQQPTEKLIKFSITGKTAICLICKAQLNHRKYISRHLMQNHNISTEKIDEIMGNKKPRPRPREELTSVAKRNECFHCKKSFRSQHLLIEHIYSILQTPKNSSDKYANKILVGNKTNNSKQNNSLVPVNRNFNLMDLPQKNMPNTNVEVSSTKEHVMEFFKCRFCLRYFKTTKIYFRHMKVKHKMVNNFLMTKVSFDPKCPHCPKTMDSVDSYNTHVYDNHRKIVLEAIEKSKRILVSSNNISSNNEERNVVSKTFTQNEFYRCDFCFLYFNDMKFLIRHVTIKHKATRMSKPKKVAFDPICKYCNGIYSTIKRYNVHLHRVHSVKYNQVVVKSTSDEGESNKVAMTDRELNETEVYRCKFCPFYFKNTKWFLRHIINKHKIKDMPKMETETFNPKCYYCPKKSNNAASYNDHLTKRHFALLNKVTVRSKPASVAKKLKVHMKPKFPKLNNCNKGETGANLIRQPHYELAYICKLCPTVFKSMRYYSRHVKIRHKLETIPKQQMVKVDLQCKFCPATFTATKYYNKHIYKYHFTEIARKPILENKATKPNVQNTNTSVNLKEKKYYRCCYCSRYFNSIDIYDTHVKNKHKVQLPHDVKKIGFDAKCKYCPTVTCSIQSYNLHLNRKHQNRLNEVFTGRSKKKINPEKTEIVKNTLLSSTSNISQKSLKRDDNMANLSSNLTPILKSALFKCNKCDIHFLTIKTASDHVNHMELLVNWKCSLCNRIFKDNDKVLHEKQHLFSHVFTVYDLNTADASHILYKCSKCNLHYDESVDNHHEQCISEIPPSYTCEICKILIDCNSKICHEYNHKHRDLTSNDFIILETDVIIDDDTNNTRSDKLNAHTANNLIGNDQVKHNKPKKNLKRKIKNSEVQIRPKKVKKTYEMFSKNEPQDIVYNENYSNMVTKNQQNFDKMLLKLSFCGTCKSFVSVIGHKRKEHMQKLCANLPTLICKDCGLRFSCKTLSTHRQVHLRIKNLQLQSFKFYNFHSGKRSMPPMPEYERCGICKVNFISKSTLGQHVCSDSEYKLCEICNIKLFTPIFNLHMAFHKYKFDEANSNSSSNSVAVCDKKEEIQTLNKNILLILYCCKVCNVYMDTYDHLIEHCHKHCLDTLSKYMEECKICKLKFDDSSLKTHGKVHEMLGAPTFNKLFFDPFYFRFDNKVWLDHVFGSNLKIMKHTYIQDIIQSSRYRKEHRFIMHVVQEGRFDLTLYKCDKCNMYVEPDMIYLHIENSCSNLRKYPCPICHLDFISSFSLTRHKITHEDPKVTLKSYRIVHFNRKEDAALNAVIFSPPKLYVLYQCRHCNGIVDSIHRMSHVCDKNSLKPCIDCELLITEDVYETHISKHQTLDSFMAENMKVILFGGYELHDKKVNYIPTTFRGKIHDYSFYKCRSCHICVKHKNSTRSHSCHKGPRISCSKCGLYFNADKLVSHTKTHETDPDFILDNMNIIDFYPAMHKTKDEESLEIGSPSNKECKIETVDDSSNKEHEIVTVDVSSNKEPEIETVDVSSNKEREIETVDVSSNKEREIETVDVPSNKEREIETVDVSINKEREIETVDVSSNKEREIETVDVSINKEREIETIDVSSYKELKIETIADSSNKDREFETVDVSINKDREIETVDVSSNKEHEIKTIDVSCNNENVNEANAESNVTQENRLVISTSEAVVETEKTADIYKCSCGLHFIDETSVSEHFPQCGTKAKQAKQNCSKCGLLFTPTILFKHLLSHHGNKLINYKFNIIEKSKI